MKYPEVNYIVESQIETLLMGNVLDYLQYLENRISRIANGQGDAWIKPKVIYEDPVYPNDGDVRSMTCFTDKVKVIKIISTNPVRKKHWSVSVGATLLLDYEENHPIAIFDATMMSAIRTSAMAVLGAMFSRSSLDDVLVIGYGRVGSYAAEIIHRKTGNTVKIIDPVIQGETADYIVNITGSPRHEASSIITASTSRTPFLSASNTEADMIISVGADTAFNFELDNDLITERGGLFVDCMDAIKVGDLSRMENAKNLVQGEIFDLYKNGQSARTLVSVGSPLMDALTVEYMALQMGIID